MLAHSATKKRYAPGATEKLLRDAAICFANSDGGTIVLGVDDDLPGRVAFLGTDFDAQFAQRRIYELTQPSILVDSEELSFEGVRLLIITVPRSFEIHADKQGRAARRVGTVCLPMSPQDQAMLREERRGVDWSGERSDISVSDVDARALDAARRRLRQGGGTTSELADLSDIELLRGLGVVDDQDRLLRSGEVLLCSSAADPTPLLGSCTNIARPPEGRQRSSNVSRDRLSSCSTGSSSWPGHDGM